MSEEGKSQITGGTWEVYSFLDETGQLAVVSFNMEAALEDRHSGLNTGARVIVNLPAQEVGSNGLPVDTAFERLRRIEKHLIRLLEQGNLECRLVGRKTAGGSQEFVFQLEDLRRFVDAIRPMLEKDTGYRTELQSQVGWEYFEHQIKPSPGNWQRIQDRKMLGELLGAGVDPGQAHLLRFTFLGQEKPLRQIEAALRKKGFAVEESEHDHLVLSKQSTLYPDLVFAASAELFDLSVSAGARYLGWQAVPLK